MSMAAIAASLIAGTAGYLGGQAQADAARASSATQAAATKEIQQMLIDQTNKELAGLERGQLEAMKRAQDLGQSATSQFMQATQSNPAQISALQDIIRRRMLPEQQQALRRGNLALTQAGVRGPEAALSQSMLAGKMGSELGLDLQKIKLEEELRRQKSREELAKQQAMQAFGKQLGAIQYSSGAPEKTTVPNYTYTTQPIGRPRPI